MAHKTATTKSQQTKASKQNPGSGSRGVAKTKPKPPSPASISANTNNAVKDKLNDLMKKTPSGGGSSNRRNHDSATTSSNTPTPPPSASPPSTGSGSESPAGAESHADTDEIRNLKDRLARLEAAQAAQQPFANTTNVNRAGAPRPRGESGRSGDGSKPGFSTRPEMHKITPISDDLWKDLRRVAREGLIKYGFDFDATYRNQEQRKFTAVEAYIISRFPDLFGNGLFRRNWPVHEIAMSAFNNHRKDLKEKAKGRPGRKKRSKKARGQQAPASSSPDDESESTCGTPPPDLVLDGDEDSNNINEGENGNENTDNDDDGENGYGSGENGEDDFYTDDDADATQALENFQQMRANLLSQFPHLGSQLDSHPTPPKRKLAPSNSHSTIDSQPSKKKRRAIVISDDDDDD